MLDPLGKTTSRFVLLLLAFAHVLALFIPVMQVDAAQYASISYQMSQTGEYLQVMNGHKDYLDKPPLLFWVSSLSISLFENTSFAYKLPSVFALLLAAFAVRAYARLMYDQRTGDLAALVMLSTTGFVLMANDCRTDNLLMAFACLAMWKLHAFNLTGEWKEAVFAGVALAGALLSKGPLGVIFPTCVFVGNLLAGKIDIRKTWYWFIIVPVIAVLLVPMSIGLYQQHGMHGLRFFYWTQSFGRVTGESRWNNDPQPFFLVQTLLWVVLPYTLIVLAAIYGQARSFVQRKNLESFIGSGAQFALMLILLALSASRYQLSHYTYLLVPLCALVAASFVRELNDKQSEQWLRVQTVLGILLILGTGVALALLYSPFHLSFALLGLAFFFVAKQQDVVQRSVLFVAVVAVLLNGLLFPKLMEFQSHSEVCFDLRAMDVPASQLMVFEESGHALSYYNGPFTLHLWDAEPALADSSTRFIFTNDKGKAELQQAGMKMELVKTYDHFVVSKLSLPFLDPRSRKDHLSKRYLFKRL